MIKRFVGTVVTAAALAVTGKLVSDYAETKPALKNVKDKLKKTGEDFAHHPLCRDEAVCAGNIGS